MHAERFGKALGVGVREAGKAALRAADAAQSPPARSERVVSTAKPMTEPKMKPETKPETKLKTGRGQGSLGQGVRGFASSAAKPVIRAGNVLWLEVTGFLFLLIALVAAGGVWAGRAHLRHGPGQAHELAGLAMLGVFLWFGVTNFLRARRRNRQP